MYAELQEYGSAAYTSLSLSTVARTLKAIHTDLITAKFASYVIYP